MDLFSLTWRRVYRRACALTRCKYFERCLLLIFLVHVIGISYAIVLLLRIVDTPRNHDARVDGDMDIRALLYIADLGPPRLNITGAPWWSVEAVPRALSQYEHAEYIRLLSSLTDLFISANITFIMCDATLLGSYMSHDLLPWDDDVDLMVHYDDLPKVKKLFRDRALWQKFQLHGYHDTGNEYDLNVLLSLPDDAQNMVYYHYSMNELDTKVPDLVLGQENAETDGNDPTPFEDFAAKNLTGNDDVFGRTRYHKFKFYKPQSAPAGKELWRWPYVDIKYFQDNETHVWNLDVPKRTHYVARDRFYPLHLRPLSSLWLPAPRDTRHFLLAKYSRFRCRRGIWSHRKETRQMARRARCWRLSRYYPFVWREKLADGVLEILKLDDQIIQYVGVPEVYEDTLKPFSL